MLWLTVPHRVPLQGRFAAITLHDGDSFGVVRQDSALRCWLAAHHMGTSQRNIRSSQKARNTQVLVAGGIEAIT